MAVLISLCSKVGSTSNPVKCPLRPTFLIVPTTCLAPVPCHLLSDLTHQLVQCQILEEKSALSPASNRGKHQ